MTQPKFLWIGLAALGLLPACPADDIGPGDDEIGNDEIGNDDSTSSDGDSSESESTSDSGESTSDTTDTTDGDETDTDETDTDETETDTDETDTDETDTDETDTTGDGDGLELVAAELADDYGTLVLSFNDNVAPVDDVEPSDFRISLAVTYQYMYMGQLYQYSYYTDPIYTIDEMATQITLTGIASGPGPDQVSLTLEPAFDPGICAAIDGFLMNPPPGFEVDAGIFPHYAPGAVPVTGEGGGVLDAIGPDWVLNDNPYMLIYEFGWPNLDPQIEIPCE